MFEKPSNSPPALPPQTVRQYLRTFSRLERARLSLAGQPPYSAFLPQIASGLRPASCRLYRAAVVFGLAHHGRESEAQAVRDLPPLTPGKNLPRRTSRKKKKSLTPEQEAQLIDYLLARQTESSHSAALLLGAGLATGLRPSEWRLARMEGDQLSVVNAKASQLRANGERRLLSISHLTPDQRYFIGQAIQIGMYYEDKWEPFYKLARQSVLRAAKALWPGRELLPSLYTARHQFAANAKRSLPLASVAALMGHATDRTATRHYAKRHQGRSAILPVPDPESVEAVRISTRSPAGPKFE